MDGFTFLDGERLIVFGAGALARAPALLSSRGFDRYALLTTGRGLAVAPALAREAEVIAEVPAGAVPEAAAAVRDSVGDRPVVALGGGRVIDSAKAIAGAGGLRCAAIPTTLSGAEMTGFHRMPAGAAEVRLARPEVVVADPALMASQPRPGLAASAINALAHAMEALYTPLSNPVSDAAALRGAQEIAGGLDDPESGHDRLALGGLLAGYACGVAGLAIHHIVCQTIVRACGTPHAQTNAVMLPHVARLMAPWAPAAMRAFGAALGATEGIGERVADLAAQAGVRRLSELGVSAGSLPDLVGAVMARPDLANTPGPPQRGDVEQLLAGAL